LAWNNARKVNPKVKVNFWLVNLCVKQPALRADFTNSGQLTGLLNADYFKPTIRVSPCKNKLRSRNSSSSLADITTTDARVLIGAVTITCWAWSREIGKSQRHTAGQYKQQLLGVRPSPSM